MCKNLLVGRKVITVDVNLDLKIHRCLFLLFVVFLVVTEAYKVNEVRKCIIIMM